MMTFDSGHLMLLLVLLLNLFALVWGAAKFAASVDRIESDIIPEITKNIRALTRLSQEHDKEIAVIKATLGKTVRRT
jgi:hypothetical protein